MDGGLAVHSLLEERDLNRASDIFGNHTQPSPTRKWWRSPAS